MDEKALLSLSSGVYVLGSVDENNRLVGSIIDTVIQVALKPLVISISCLNTSYTKSCIEKNGKFAISVLPVTVDPFIVANFGFQSSRNINKWDNIKHEYLDSLPYLTASNAAIEGEVIEKISFDSHTLFVAKVLQAVYIKDDEPLTYAYYRSSFKNEVFKFLPQIMKNKEKNND